MKGMVELAWVGVGVDRHTVTTYSPAVPYLQTAAYSAKDKIQVIWYFYLFE